MTGSEQSFDDAIELLQNSAIGRAALAVPRMLAAAVPHSRTTAAVRDVRSAILRLTAAERLRLASATAAIAAATHLAGRALLSARMAPAAPASAMVLVLIVALLVAVLATPVTQAVRSSRDRQAGPGDSA